MKPVFGQRELFIAESKIEAASVKALAAMRQLGFAVATYCPICSEGKGVPIMPWEVEENSFPCEHLRCYDSSLRGFGLDALNAAAKIWAAEKSAEKDGLK